MRTGQELSHYQVHELLGTGGMGEVYRATDLKLRRSVALKFLRPLSDAARRERMLREARAASLLDHPNICTIFEIDETPQGEIFIAMAYYEGMTLDRVLRKGPLPVGRALSIAIQAGRGLAAAHDELIVHRDIKPANLMITHGDTVKILDFGIAKMLTDTTSTRDDALVGTLAYLAPEQLRGDPTDQRMDIWSLGAVLHEMITGSAPFGGEHVGTMIASILSNEPVRLARTHPGMPPPVARIIEKSLAKSPRARYERMDTMVQHLVEAQALLDSNAVVRPSRAVAARSSIAVLPFEDMTAARDQEYLCDGIAEEILRALSRIPELYVASRTSSFQFKKRSADIREIGTHLNVDSILEGSVRRIGDRVRVSAQLINVQDGYRLWNERYDREMRDIFTIEDEIAEQIAHALEIALGAPGPTMAKSGSTPDAQAYEYYLRGREFIHQH
ncbi:MAG TPA: serine/threonine-protein kinase, partial [Candidatus Eisenbacteria bacterium]